MHSIIVEVAATLACFGFLSPIRFPTLVDDAKPIASGTIKNKLAIFIATECPATTISPRTLNIIAAPENILNSIKIPNPIGRPSLKTSFVVVGEGGVNSANGFVFLYFSEIFIYINIDIIIINDTIVVAIPQPTPPSFGAPK